VNDDIRRCAEEMLAIMRSENGIGLSANQVGLPLRMFVMEWQGAELCLINPVVRSFGKTKSKQEGCLSFPDVLIEVKRKSQCHVTGFDLYGGDIDEDVDGDLARLVLHETDHLDGILFIDRLTEMQRKTQPLASHLRAMDAAWERHGSKRNFPMGPFNEILYDYCGVERPNVDTVDD
jgi:peptide deformylase